MSFKIRISDTFDASGPLDGEKTVYSVEVADGTFVDVMHVQNTGLIYIMQSDDGEEIYGNSSDSMYCKDEVIALVETAIEASAQAATKAWSIEFGGSLGSI